MRTAVRGDLARLCLRLVNDKKLAAVYSWHDLRHAFAQRNAFRGPMWRRARLGHASISMMERYLRNVLGVDTEAM
jgi:integrase